MIQRKQRKQIKQIKKRYNSKRKFKKSIFIFLFILSIIYIIFNRLLYLKNKRINETFSTQSQEKISEISNSNIDLSNNVEISHDTKISELLDTIRLEKNLNEHNFSFFYFNITDNKYYFYNPYKYFSGASTVKLPVAMYYYDKINSGKLTSTNKLFYHNSCNEPGFGTTSYTYSPGQYVPINFLLEQSIINSDNTAVNILIRNLGYMSYRYDITKYTNEVLPQAFYSDNLTCAAYGFDVINYLYQHRDSYTELISNMKKASTSEYLKKYIKDYDVAHKYGCYKDNVHDYGIVFGKDTYLIGIYTKGISNADELIANINLDILNYTLNN